MPNIQQTVDFLTTEILILKQQTAQNIIEIGKRLNQVKESLPHGEWGQWLADRIEFSQRTANNFMRAANEFSNSQSLANLPQTKIFALLDLPADQRPEFIEKNPVADMTTRELQQAIRDKKTAEARAESLTKSLESVQAKAATVDTVSEENSLLRAANKQLETKLRAAGDPIVVETPVQVFPPDYERIKRENEQFKAQQNASTDFKQYANQVENESETANKVINALMSPQLVSLDNLSHAIQCYLEYSPASVSDAINDCAKSMELRRGWLLTKFLT